MSLVGWVRVCLAAIVVLWSVVAYQDCQNKRLAANLAKTAADLQESRMTAEGWERTAKATEREMGELVPDLTQQLEAAKAVNAKLLAASTATGSVTIRVRPPAPGGPPPLAGSIGGQGETTSPLVVSPGPQVDVEIEAKFQEAVAGLADGRIEWTRRLWLRQAGLDAPWSEVPLQGEAVVAPELVAAWKAYIAPRRKIRFGWTVAVGVGIGIDGRPNAGVFAGWGVQF